MRDFPFNDLVQMQIYFKKFQKMLNTEVYAKLPITTRKVSFFDSSCEENTIIVSQFFVHKNDTEVFLQGYFQINTFAIIQINFDNSLISINNRADFNNFIQTRYQDSIIRIDSQAVLTIYPCL